MKVVILAGGFGTRISEESHLKPKPMIEIGDQPILWHIMKIYSHYGFNDFIICLGYKGYVIKEYFANYFLHQSNVTFDFTDHNGMIVHDHKAEPWKVTLIDTGVETMTGGRLKRAAPYIEDDTFFLTYGDGVADVHIDELLAYHKSGNQIATVTTVQPPGRFGVVHLREDNTVLSFSEKPKGEGAWISGGYFVMNKKIFDYLEGDKTILEKDPLKRISREHQLKAFKHTGFWYPMDTQRDKVYLEELWKADKAPWKVW
jgi:glucose-1-phosphate cytidylyltransferase